jgi:hypothetical protein
VACNSRKTTIVFKINGDDFSVISLYARISYFRIRGMVEWIAILKMKAQFEDSVLTVLVLFNVNLNSVTLFTELNGN